MECPLRRPADHEGREVSLSDHKRTLRAGKAQRYRIKVIEKENKYRKAQERHEQGRRKELQRIQAAHHSKAMRQQYLRVRAEACRRRHAPKHDEDQTQWEVTITQIDHEDTDQCVWRATDKKNEQDTKAIPCRSEYITVKIPESQAQAGGCAPGWSGNTFPLHIVSRPTDS